MDNGKVVLGILAGVAAGALLGILFAPEKGSTTRKRIYRRGEDLTDDLKDKFDDFMDGVSEKFEKVKKDVTNFAEKSMNNAEAAEKNLEKDLEKEVKAAKH
jgi:gas vesicle protein